MSVKRLLQEVDSREMASWFAYDQLWPISDGWQQTARICRIIMAASGNYKKVPDEEVFIPSKRKPVQTQEQMFAELMKLQNPAQG
jgi:hypothetical protein